MKKILVNLLKYNQFIYALYYYSMNILLRFMSFFVGTNSKIVVFNSFAGRNYDDSPRLIFEAMREDERFKDYRFIWTFHNPEEFSIVGGEKIKTDTFQYFKTVLSARVWITNSSVERGLRFKKKNTHYLNTWHGTPLKFMGSDIVKDNKSFSSKGKSTVDAMLSQSRYETAIFSRSFGIDREKFLEFGLPRNDVLLDFSQEKKLRIKQELGISDSKKVILYCPTFREYDKDLGSGIVMAPPFDSSKWAKELDDYVVLVRAHYEVSKVMDIAESDVLKNVTTYPVLNNLFSIADVLISDYSSVYFDFSITEKPMLHYTYDFDKYNSSRGMYFDIRDYLNGAAEEDELIKLIKKLDVEKETQRTVMFRDMFVTQYGFATQKTLDYLHEQLQK